MATALGHPAGRNRNAAHSQREPLGLRRTVVLGVLVAVAATLLATLVLAAGTERLGHDFRTSYLEAAQSVRETGSPYLAPQEPVPVGHEPYVYPPLLAVVLVPLTEIPEEVAAAGAVALSLAALLIALALVGVRDPLCYAALIVWAPIWNALEMANVSAALALGLAIAWRYRAETLRSAIAMGLTFSTKLFLWPVLVWSVATARVRTALAAVGIGLAVSASSWWWVGLQSLPTYPDQLARIPMEDSYSIPAVVAAYHGSMSAGSALAILVAASSLALTMLFGRRGDDLRALTCAIAASLTLTPVVWQHYLVLLAVPIAIARPRFSSLWLLPTLLWLSPRAGHGEGIAVALPMIVALAVTCTILLRPTQTKGLGVRFASVAR